MREQNWRFVNRAAAVAAVTVMAVSFATFAAAEKLQNEDLSSIFASAAKEPTNVGGVGIFAGVPKGFDFLAATNRELAWYGLPQRPDKAVEPKAYQIWERAMLAAKHRAPAKLEVKSFTSTNMGPAGAESAISATQTATSSDNWSGVADTNKNKSWNNKTSFALVASVFNVPVAQPPFGACANGITGPFYEVSWNGIDGFSNGDVVQGGSLSAADCYGNTQYEAWIEWYPSYTILAAFEVNPGDDMYVITYGYPGSSTQYVFVEDLTLQTYGMYSLPYLKGPGLVGSSAEWIVERPCCAANGSPLALANTIYDFFNYALALDGGGTYFYAGSPAAVDYNINMVADDGSTVIENVNTGTAGEQGLESLWFADGNCAYSGGCVP